MTFYTIVTKKEAGKHSCDISLERACKRAGITYVRLIAEDVVLEDLQSMDLAPGLIYRVSLSVKSETIEAILAARRGDLLTTIYYPRTNEHPKGHLRGLLNQQKNKLPIIPTSIIDDTWVQMSDEELITRADKLGGFPLVMKTLGFSRGIGVSRVDTLQEFKERLISFSGIKFNVILRKYLADYRHYRLVVVDDKVVAAIEYHKPDDDFRTNASDRPNVTKLDHTMLPADICDMALAGVTLRSSLLGGVDILIDQSTGDPYLAEVNVPCNFARAEEPTGVDIATEIINALSRKHLQESRH